LNLFADISENNFINYDIIKRSRYNKELKHLNKIITDIVKKRKHKYKIPVPGYKLPKYITKLPNSARNYRKDYTDGIHHGIDIDAPLWSRIVSIDDGIVIKVVKDFKFSDLNQIKRWKNLTYEQKLKNLDILRGNQVWIKTMKWDVVFFFTYR